jgi:hypothetical protein
MSEKDMGAIFTEFMKLGQGPLIGVTLASFIDVRR